MLECNTINSTIRNENFSDQNGNEKSESSNTDTANVGKMYRIKDGYCLRDFCGESLVIPINQNTMRENRTALLSPVAGFIWNKLKTWQSFDDLLEAVLSEYDVGREAAEKDILTFLNELEKKDYSITRGI